MIPDTTGSCSPTRSYLGRYLPSHLVLGTVLPDLGAVPTVRQGTVPVDVLSGSTGGVVTGLLEECRGDVVLVKIVEHFFIQTSQ